MFLVPSTSLERDPTGRSTSVPRRRSNSLGLVTATTAHKVIRRHHPTVPRHGLTIRTRRGIVTAERSPQMPPRLGTFRITTTICRTPPPPPPPPPAVTPSGLFVTREPQVSRTLPRPITRRTSPSIAHWPLLLQLRLVPTPPPLT